jgi:hypothetical protein
MAQKLMLLVHGLSLETLRQQTAPDRDRNAAK